jgi:hypothetical protein
MSIFKIALLTICVQHFVLKPVDAQASVDVLQMRVGKLFTIGTLKIQIAVEGCVTRAQLHECLLWAVCHKCVCFPQIFMRDGMFRARCAAGVLDTCGCHTVLHFLASAMKTPGIGDAYSPPGAAVSLKPLMCCHFTHAQSNFFFSIFFKFDHMLLFAGKTLMGFVDVF